MFDDAGPDQARTADATRRRDCRSAFDCDYAARIVAAIGDVIGGKYRLLRLLGDGGMGSVYEASHEMLGTKVAIKVLHADLVRRTGLIDRFLQEARVAAQIKSPHVVQVTDVDRSPSGLAYIVMELLEGEALSATLDRQAKLPLATACDFASQILAALEAAHSLGVTHRDLKPENVFVTYQGAAKPVLKLIDFGIAKLRSSAPGERSLTVAGMLMGTAEYMAPEQAYSADKVDGRSDIYAVGVMLYEMLAGKRPVHGDDARAIAIKVERGEVTPLVHAATDVPREIAGLVHRAMAPRPELRFATATEMRLALEAALSGKRAPTGAAPLPPPAAAPAKFATMQSAPVQAAFGPAERATTGTDAPPRTERAPGPAPIPFAAVPSVTHATPVAMPPSPSVLTRPRRRGGAAIMVVIPLVVGVGAVVVWVVTTQGTSAPASIPSPPAWTAPSRVTAAPLATPGPVPTVAPLQPSPVSPRPAGGSRAPHPGGSTSAAASSAPSAAPTAAQYVPPPFSIPTGFGFPPADGGSTLIPFPVPSGFPTTLPTAFPSTLPFPFPAPTPEPAPAPSPAKSI